MGLVGTPYRKGGRDTQNGLDCLGLVLVVFDLPQAPSRNRPEADVAGRIGRHFVETERPVSGALVVMRRALRWHFGVQTEGGLVHADASARRVVLRPGALPWPLHGIFRRMTWLL